MLDWTNAETASTLGSVTYEPPPAPFDVRIRFCAARTRSASRTVARETPKSVASAASFGSRSPGCRSPWTTRSRSRSATSSYCLTATSVDAELAVAGDGGRRRDRGQRVLAEVLGERPAVPVRAQLRPPCLRRHFVDLQRPLVREDDAVRVAGQLDRREVVEHVLAYRLRRPLERVAVAGRVGLAELDELAGRERDPGHFRRQDLLPRGVGVLAARGDE